MAISWQNLRKKKNRIIKRKTHKKFQDKYGFSEKDYFIFRLDIVRILEITGKKYKKYKGYV